MNFSYVHLAFLLISALVFTQCKTFDRSQLHEDDTTVGEWTRKKLEYTAPYSFETHYPPPKFEGNKCVKDAYAHLFADREYSNSLGFGLGWWQAAEGQLVVTKGDELNVKLFLAIIDLEIRCPVDTGTETLPGCKAGNRWAPYYQLSYQLDTLHQPLLARNFLILLANGYFNSPQDKAQNACDEKPMNSADLESCIRSKLPEFKDINSNVGKKCKEFEAYSIVHQDPVAETVPFSSFIANGMWRTFQFAKFDVFPFVGSLPGQDPYVMRVPLENQETAYPGDLVILSEENKGLVTKLALFHPNYNRTAVSNQPVVLGKYQSHDGEKIVNEIERHIDIGNEVRIKNIRLITRGVMPVTRGYGDEPIRH